MYIGVDVGGTKCAVVRANEQGEIVNKVKFDTLAYEVTLNRIIREVKACGKARAIGVSCGGPLDSQRGVILSPPNLPKWDNVEIVKILERETGIKTYLQNDANACALAEWKLGAGKGCKHMIFLTFGTGMGAGLILNGRLYEGTNGNAGEVGHVRLRRCGPTGFGKVGSFEGFCSGGGIARAAKREARKAFEKGMASSYCKSIEDIDGITAKRVADCAKDGREDAIAIYERCGEKLGEALAILIDVLNPEKIVIGSIYERSGELLQDAMYRKLNAECLPSSLAVCEIVSAKLGDKIGDYAAIAVAMCGGCND